MSLFAFLQKFGFPERKVAVKMIKGLLKGIRHLHRLGIMHRDLKLENIMVRDNHPTNVKPVIVDLGLAENIDSTKYLYTRCGTPGYVAPEVLQIKSDDKNKTYTQACDLFSLGVIFHIMYDLYVNLG
jgi:serine/threonine protein kinase